MNKIRIAYITTQETDILPLISALKELLDEKGEIAELCLKSGDDLITATQLEEFIPFASSSHLVILNLHGGKQSLNCFDDLIIRPDMAEVPIHVQSSTGPDMELMRISTDSEDEYRTMSQYINYGGKENFKQLILYAANRHVGTGYAVSKPVRSLWVGIHHPDLDHIPSLEEYLENKYIDGRLTVGLWFYQSYWQSEDVQFFECLINEIERQGANVIPVFLHRMKDIDLGAKGTKWVIENYFMRNGKPIIDVLISPLMFSLTMLSTEDSDDTNFLKRLGVPVIKAIVTHDTRGEWINSTQGLAPIDVSTNIAMPEFDGVLITVPVATRERNEIDPLTGASVIRHEPIDERIRMVVRLGLNWARLGRIPNEDKKVAIIFHNYPPRNDQIGTAFGLDSSASVWNILRVLKGAGYKLDQLPENGQTLIEEVRSSVTNERQWTGPAELANKAIDTVSGDVYRKWFGKLPATVQNKMIEAWGPPPGDLFVHEDKLIIPGIVNDNVFIGLQPPRGFHEDPSAIYHSPDHPFPHHYYAYYRWIRDVFGAHLIMHIGKHGTLEWLPGKSVGLSDSCFPDIAISDLPNIYPYIVNNTGEGIQAKRRSYCCIIGHLIPVMHNADAYEELAELEVLLRDYNHVVLEDPGKVIDLQRRIWEKVCDAKLDHDLQLDEMEAFSNFESFLERLHDYLYELSDTQIRDGLHILGEPPEGSRLDEFLVALTKLSNGDVPSLRESLARALGYSYDELLSGRGKIIDGKRVGGQIIEEIHDISLRLMAAFHDENFRLERIGAVEDEILRERDGDIEKILNYVGTFLAPSIEATTDELSGIISASQGSYIYPGPSGAPTRGMADVLPTGRNFYSFDPRTLPSPGAWKIGVAEAKSLLNRYLQDEGQYPENIGIIIWGSPTMRNGGDDVAEVLYLMGVRPLWEPLSGRVRGIEVIPLEELERPRIDVTLRISGLFRDAFPNTIDLIDEAVEMVASLGEPHEENYLAKHVAGDVKEKVDQDSSTEQARKEACYRIFGCRPGTYGAGISEAIESKNWQDEKDLAQIYVTWGGYAYGRNDYGISVPDQFGRRLSQLDLTVKNEDTREEDMLDSDDFYSFHGGLIAAVKTFKGELPRSYSGDSSDPDHVKTRSTEEETKHIFRARVLNPKWIKSMQRHGYKGAADLSATVDFAFGWDATAEVLEDWMYEALANKYALDKEMQEWFKEVNPHALQNIAERLLEAIERGMWGASEKIKEELREIYLEIEGTIEDCSA